LTIADQDTGKETKATLAVLKTFDRDTAVKCLAETLANLFDRMKESE
jgi:hypothetical protein